MNKIADIIRTDVLIIGAGAAGIRAAVEAKKEGVDTLLIIKGELGKTGSTFYPLGWGRGFQASLGAVDKQDTPDRHTQEILEAGLDMCSERLSWILAQEAPGRIKDLMDYGLEFEKHGGEYVRICGCFSKCSRVFLVTNMEKIRRGMTEIVRKGNISVMENFMVVELIVNQGECVGVVGVDREGEVVVLQAKSVVLATGGGGGIFRFNLNPTDITGDGQAMAFRAGAELTNLEFFQIGFAFVYPLKRMLLEGILFRYKPEIYNGRRREFIPEYLPSDVGFNECLRLRAAHMPFSTRDVSKYIDIASFVEITRGRAAKHGGIILDLTKLSTRIIRSNPLGQAWCSAMMRKGFDCTKTPMEITLHVHALNGGLKINEKTETTVPGLYAAGEVAAGPHGADRLGGNMMTATQVFGARAGRYAARRAKSMKRSSPDKRISEQVKTNIVSLRDRKKGLLVRNVKEKIQRTMWRNVLVNRNAEYLLKCISVLDEIEKNDLPQVKISGTEELFHALALPNMVQTGKMIATAAQIRKESRGSHHRADFPNINPILDKSIVLYKEGEKVAHRLEHL